MTGFLDDIWRGRVFYLFVLPFAALTILFGVWPIILSIQVSFTASATALRPNPTYVGFANYLSVFADPLFAASLARTLLYTALSVVANLAFALGFAMLLDSALIRRGNLFFRLAIFLPVVTPDVAGYVVWRWLYDRSFGAINAFLKILGLPAFTGLSSADTAMLSLLIAELWHHAGFYMIIFLANLAIRDRALEEAAHIDGATTWQRWRYVILPQLRPALLINTVYALIQFLKTFTVVVVMTKGGPNDQTNFVSYYAYQLFDQGRYGEATAMATILFAVVIAISMSAYLIGEQGRAAMNDIRPNRALQAAAYAVAGLTSLVFLYPYWWMLVSAFRPTRAIMSNPLRLLPERFDLSIFAEIGRIGGVDLWVYAWNSVLITGLSTLLSVVVTALGAYALVRRPDLPGFRVLRYGFLVTIMYPYMLLVIPVYLVMFKLGLLGASAGIILFLALGPIQFFLFEQFFRAIPGEVIEAAIIDGASEAQVLFKIVLPMAAPITATVALITFLLNWSQWFPILVISKSPDTYTLPVALLSMNSELGSNFQGIMALAVLTTLPVAVLFLLAQKRVMEGMASGAVKG